MSSSTSSADYATWNRSAVAAPDRALWGQVLLLPRQSAGEDHRLPVCHRTRCCRRHRRARPGRPAAGCGTSWGTTPRRAWTRPWTSSTATSTSSGAPRSLVDARLDRGGRRSTRATGTPRPRLRRAAASSTPTRGIPTPSTRSGTGTWTRSSNSTATSGRRTRATDVRWMLDSEVTADDLTGGSCDRPGRRLQPLRRIRRSAGLPEAAAEPPGPADVPGGRRVRREASSSPWTRTGRPDIGGPRTSSTTARASSSRTASACSTTGSPSSSTTSRSSARARIR